MSVATVTPLQARRSPREMLRQWVEENYADQEEVETADVVEAAVRHFRHNDEFLDAFVTSGISELLAHVLVGVFTASRKYSRLSSGYVSSGAIERAAESRLAKWKVHVAPGIYKDLPKTTKAELLWDISERKKRHRTEGAVIAFQEEIASGIGRNNKTVESVYSLEKLEAIHDKYFGD